MWLFVADARVCVCKLRLCVCLRSIHPLNCTTKANCIECLLRATRCPRCFIHGASFYHHGQP